MGKLNDLAVQRMLNSKEIGYWVTPTYKVKLYGFLEKNRDLYVYCTYDNYTGNCTAYQLKVQYTKQGKAYIVVQNVRVHLKNMLSVQPDKLPIKYRNLFYGA